LLDFRPSRSFCELWAPWFGERAGNILNTWSTPWKSIGNEPHWHGCKIPPVKKQLNQIMIRILVLRTVNLGKVTFSQASLYLVTWVREVILQHLMCRWKNV
jgi:hypothetical protein